MFKVILALALVCCVAAGPGSLMKIYRRSRDALLADHNKERAQFSLPPMRWNWQLQRYAEENVVKCVFAHTSCKMGPEQIRVGENLYWSWSSEGNYNVTEELIKASQSWASEKKYVDRSWSCMRNLQCGHYTQQIWRESTQVGCAVAKCPGSRGGAQTFCNYLEPGNFNVGTRTSPMQE